MTDKAIIETRRQSGRSTRLADLYIGIFLLTGRVEVLDHHDSENAHNELFHMVRWKLEKGYPEIYKNCDVKMRTITYRY